MSKKIVSGGGFAPPDPGARDGGAKMAQIGPIL
jgi:hypothetical protein